MLHTVSTIHSFPHIDINTLRTGDADLLF